MSENVEYGPPAYVHWWELCEHKYACAQAYLRALDHSEREEFQEVFKPWEALECPCRHNFELDEIVAKMRGLAGNHGTDATGL